MLMTVAHVRHPDLDDTERHFLLALSLNATEKGKNAYPGQDALGKRIDRTTETVRKRVERCIALGLIVCSHESKGRNDADAFDFVLTHPAYPESYPERDRALARKPSTPSLGLGYSKSITASLKTDHPKSIGPAPQAVEVSTPSVGSCPSLTTSQPQPTTSPQTDPVVVVNLLTTLFVEKEGEPPKGLTKKQVAAMKHLVRAHGEEKFLSAGKAWVSEAPWNSETKSHFAAFVNNFTAYLAVADFKAKHKKAELTPEAIAEIVERSQKAHAAFWSQGLARKELLAKEGSGEDGNGEELFDESPVIPDGSSEESNNE